MTTALKYAAIALIIYVLRNALGEGFQTFALWGTVVSGTLVFVIKSALDRNWI